MICDPVDLAGDEVDGNILYFFCRGAAIDGASFYPGAFQDDGARCDDGIAPDLRIVHNNGSHANQYFITDGTSVYNGVMSDGDIVADNGLGLLVGGMDHHSVLYIYFTADPDAIDITPYSTVEPYTLLLSYSHITHHAGISAHTTLLS